MNKNYLNILMMVIFAAITFLACNEAETVDPSSAKPEVSYLYEILEADLNLVDNLPIVAVVKSEIGLKSVRLDVKTKDGEIVNILTETEFFNNKLYSLSERISYKAEYAECIVAATDILDREIESTLPINIIDVIEVPSIVFTPPSIEYNETVGGDMPNTCFEISTSATLSSVEMWRVKTTGQELYTSITFSDEDPQSTYVFDDLISYGEFDKGFKVKVTDSYGQIRIETLPVSYITVEPPVITFADEVIYADKDEEKSVNLDIVSEAGLVSIDLYRIEGSNEEFIKTTTYQKLNELAYSETMIFTNATSGVKIIATDNVGRKTTKQVGACVNMYYEVDLHVITGPVVDGVQLSGDQAYASGSNRLFSFGDLKTYSVQECFTNTELQSHIDMKVYYMYGNSSAIRIYSPENGDSKNSEYSYDGQSLNNFSVINMTRFKDLGTTYDFDGATAEDIAQIEAASIASSNVKTADGVLPIFAFKTGSTSSAGSAKIGIAKLAYISEPIGSNMNARIFTFEVKIPKVQ